jgi:hypothetical protein
MSGKHRIQDRSGRVHAAEWYKQSTFVYFSDQRPEPSWPTVIATTVRLFLERRGMMQRRRISRPESILSRQMIRLALLIAGQRRAYLRDAWRADLYADDGRRLSAWRRSRHSTGYVIAAINYRLINDLGGVLSRLLDAVLVSRSRTRVVIACLYLVPIVMILFNQGAYGLVQNAGSLAVVAAGLGAGLRWLRRRRGIEPPKRDSESRGK